MTCCVAEKNDRPTRSLSFEVCTATKKRRKALWPAKGFRYIPIFVGRYRTRLCLCAALRSAKPIPLSVVVCFLLVQYRSLMSGRFCPSLSYPNIFARFYSDAFVLRSRSLIFFTTLYFGRFCRLQWTDRSDRSQLVLRAVIWLTYQIYIYIYNIYIYI